MPGEPEPQSDEALVKRLEEKFDFCLKPYRKIFQRPFSFTAFILFFLGMIPATAFWVIAATNTDAVCTEPLPEFLFVQGANFSSMWFLGLYLWWRYNREFGQSLQTGNRNEMNRRIKNYRHGDDLGRSGDSSLTKIQFVTRDYCVCCYLIIFVFWFVWTLVGNAWYNKVENDDNPLDKEEVNNNICQRDNPTLLDGARNAVHVFWGYLILGILFSCLACGCYYAQGGDCFLDTEERRQKRQDEQYRKQQERRGIGKNQKMVRELEPSDRTLTASKKKWQDQNKAKLVQQRGLTQGRIQNASNSSVVTSRDGQTRMVYFGSDGPKRSNIPESKNSGLIPTAAMGDPYHRSMAVQSSQADFAAVRDGTLNGTTETSTEDPENPKKKEEKKGFGSKMKGLFGFGKKKKDPKEEKLNEPNSDANRNAAQINFQTQYEEYDEEAAKRKGYDDSDETRDGVFYDDVIVEELPEGYPSTDEIGKTPGPAQGSTLSPIKAKRTPNKSQVRFASEDNESVSSGAAGGVRYSYYDPQRESTHLHPSRLVSMDEESRQSSSREGSEVMNRSESGKGHHYSYYDPEVEDDHMNRSDLVENVTTSRRGLVGETSSGKPKALNSSVKPVKLGKPGEKDKKERKEREKEEKKRQKQLEKERKKKKGKIDDLELKGVTTTGGATTMTTSAGDDDVEILDAESDSSAKDASFPFNPARDEEQNGDPQFREEIYLRQKQHLEQRQKDAESRKIEEQKKRREEKLKYPLFAEDDEGTSEGRPSAEGGDATGEVSRENSESAIERGGDPDDSVRESTLSKSGKMSTPGEEGETTAVTSGEKIEEGGEEEEGTNRTTSEVDDSKTLKLKALIGSDLEDSDEEQVEEQDREIKGSRNGRKLKKSAADDNDTNSSGGA